MTHGTIDVGARSAPSTLRCALVWICSSIALVVAAIACLLASAAPLDLLLHELGILDGHRTATARPTESAVLLIAGLAGALACLRLWLVVSHTCWLASRGRAARRTGLARRLTLLACGLAVSAGALVPAHASPLDSLDGLPLPTLPVSGTLAPEPRSTDATSVDAPGAALTTGTATSAAADGEVTDREQAPVAPQQEAAPSATPDPAGVREQGPTPTPTPDLEPALTGNVTTEPEPGPSPVASDPSAVHDSAPDTATGTSPESHRVVAGDTLWDLARTRLEAAAPGNHVSDRAVASYTAALHAENRHIVGHDPDHIVPGQRLTLPSTPTHDSTPSSTVEENR